MYIKYINIKNFRGLDLELNNLKNNFLVIGKNDSGKSNFCQAINKVLNYLIRKNPLEDSDSTNYNKEDITIEIHFNLSEISPSNYSEIAKYVEWTLNDGEKILIIKYIGKYNETIYCYEEEIIFGKNDKFIFSPSKSNPLDKILLLTYINANYDLEKSKKSFFKFTKDNEMINVDVSNEINALNNSINLDEDVAKINDKLNASGFEEIFENINFKISSNIDISNLNKSLDVIPQLLNTNNSNDNIKNIGDGKSKILSLALDYIKIEKEKEKIFIIEEPENNMYPLLQKKFAQVISKLGLSQVIYTTHSPYIIDLKKTDQIIKLDPKSVEKKYTLNIDRGDFDNIGDKIFVELTEMFFYDLVILIEGWTEKYFYSKLERDDERFSDFLYKKNGGIFCVYGVGFSRIKSMLESLGIKVIIKTDNDIYKISRKEKKQYAGIKRVLDCLNEEEINKIRISLGFNNNEEIKELFNFSSNFQFDDNIEKNMNSIIEILSENGIIISKNHEGFEGDFYDFISQNNSQITLNLNKEQFIKKMNDAKLKNLHSFTIKESIKLKIDEENEENCLVNFIKNYE